MTPPGFWKQRQNNFHYQDTDQMQNRISELYSFISCINDYHNIVYNVDSKSVSIWYLDCAPIGAHIRPHIKLLVLFLWLWFLYLCRVHTESLNKDYSVSSHLKSKSVCPYPCTNVYLNNLQYMIFLFSFVFCVSYLFFPCRQSSWFVENTTIYPCYTKVDRVPKTSLCASMKAKSYR